MRCFRYKTVYWLRSHAPVRQGDGAAQRKSQPVSAIKYAAASIQILSNTESLDQYRLGNALSAILHGGQPPHSSRLEEIYLPPEELEKYVGTYLPGKIQIEQKNGKLYLVRVNQDIHVELYCVGRHQFKRRYEEQEYIHTLLPEENTEPSVWGYKRLSTQ